jgi:hypothetical protein
LGSKASAAFGAFATTADLCAIVSWARVDYAGIVMSAEWADHAACLLSNAMFLKI